MTEPKSLAEIRAELAADAEGCEACEQYGECIDHDTGWLDEQAERIYRKQVADSNVRPCGARTVFWPEDEACEAECILPHGHAGLVHEDKVLGEWDETDLTTFHADADA
ncbi:hypothetical protein [Streptomyces sp. NPDC055105]|uniref:hypothetical protein n=1 Tax=Streptomyces sp. NPDC055105 TaxID=3365719 RepID=UPI0037D2EF30